MMARRQREHWTTALVLFGYIAATLVMTLPGIFCFSTHVWGGAGDACMFVWNTAWFRHCALAGTNPFFTHWLFYPVGVDLTFHDLSLTNCALSFLPSLALNPIQTYNLIMCLHFVLSGFAMYLLAYRVTGSGPAAFIAGLAFAFTPYRVNHFQGHLSLSATEWLPLYVYSLLAAHRAAAGPGRRWLSHALLAGLWLAAATFSSYYYLIFLVVGTVPFVAGLMIDQRRWLSPREWRGVAGSLAAGFVLIAPVIVPMTLRYASLTDPAEAMELNFYDVYSADAVSFVTPALSHTMLKNISPMPPLLRRIYRTAPIETTTTSGWVITILGLATVMLPGRWPFKLLGLTGFTFALGPKLLLFGWETQVPLPYELLKHVPLLRIARVPARFSILLTISLCVMAAAALARWFQRARHPRCVGVGVTALMFAELLFLPIDARYIVVPPSIQHLIKAEDAHPVLIPDQNEAISMFFQVLHRRPISTCHLAKVLPDDKERLRLALTPLIRQSTLTNSDIIPRDIAMISELKRLGFGYLLFNRTFFAGTEEAAEIPANAMEAIPLEPLISDYWFILYNVPDLKQNVCRLTLGPGWSAFRSHDGIAGRTPQDQAAISVWLPQPKPALLEVSAWVAPGERLAIELTGNRVKEVGPGRWQADGLGTIQCPIPAEAQQTAVFVVESASPPDQLQTLITSVSVAAVRRNPVRLLRNDE